MAGKELWILDKRPDRAKQIEQNRIHIEGISGERRVSVKITADPADIGKADLVLICVKSPDTSSAANHAAPLVKENTVVMTLQNGLGNVERIAEAVGPEHVIGGTTSQGATLLDIGHIRHAGKGETTIGEINGKISERLQNLQKLFEECGFPTKLTDDLDGLLWSKLVINVGINALTAVSRMRNGKLIEYEGTRAVLRAAVQEAIEVASKAGIRLLFNDPVAKVEDVCRATAANISSMLQDVLRKRRTEVEYINGAVVRRAAELGISTPVNETLTRLVQTIEKSYSDQILSM
jgi:2-dehydropantoate 2-reductase